MSGVSSRHPLYTEQLENWEQMRDTYKGERAVKAVGQRYLPATSGMHADGMGTVTSKGFLAYDAYRTRAQFPEFVRVAVESMIGVMHNKPPKIELPAALEPLRNRATLRNESLELLLRRINEAQLVMGRVGLMADVLNGVGVTLPHFVTYVAGDIINWDDGLAAANRIDSLNLVVLSEPDLRRTDVFSWEVNRTRYRVLVLGDPGENEPKGLYRVGVFDEAESGFSEGALKAPSIAGKTLDRIPFVFVNTKDITAAPDTPPLLGLSNLSLTVYRGEADYRQALFMQGQDTLVVIGTVDDASDFRTGANAAIKLPIGGDAKYIGVDSSGLAEMRSALENDHSRASRKSGELMDETSRERESGEALRVRVAARTATLNQIALTGAFGLQEILRIAAMWVGANPEEVLVEPNLDFVDDEMTGEDLTQLMSAKMLGAPISLDSVHLLMRQRGMTEKTLDEELAAIEEEKALELVPPPTTNPDGPEADAEGEEEDESESEDASDSEEPE